MRITGGEFRGRRLETPAGKDIRPTSDKVRQAIFNILNARGIVRDANVLDAFCGTGALGLEALSQGAAHCTFLDKNRTSIDLCRRNCTSFGLKETVSFLLRDSSKAGAPPSGHAPADLVFLDPPYGKQLVPLTLGSLLQNGWLAQSAYILAEAEKGFDPAPLAAMAFEVVLSRDYGDTRIVLAQSGN